MQLVEFTCAFNLLMHACITTNKHTYMHTYICNNTNQRKARNQLESQGTWYVLKGWYMAGLELKWRREGEIILL